MNTTSTRTPGKKPSVRRYLLWSLLALVVLIPIWACVSGWVIVTVRPDWFKTENAMYKWMTWIVVFPMLLVAAVASAQWSIDQEQASAASSGASSAAAAASSPDQAARRPDDVLEVIGLGVTLDKYRQGRLWDALSKGNAYASIREQDPKKYPWAANDKIGQADGRSGNTLENGARSLPMYFGIPVFTASASVHNDTYRDRPDNPMVGTAGAEQVGMAFHLFVGAGSQSEERPDEILNKVFSFFDQHPDVPYVVLTVDDGISPRDDYLPPNIPSLVKDGYYIPEMPDSSALFVLARRDRVERIRPFVFEDVDEDKYNGEELNRRSFSRKLMVAYMDLAESVPKPKGYPKRTPTVAEWLQATRAFAQRSDIYPHSVSNAFAHLIHDAPSIANEFKPTPWFPIPWNKDQLAAFDKLPTLGFIHRPVFVPMVDKDGHPLTRRDERTAALAAGWQQALQTLPEAQRKAAPARVLTATGGNVNQTIVLHGVLNQWTHEGGPELDTSKSTQWIDTDARLGNTGAATWFMQMAIGVMGSYKEGGASAAINLRDPNEASIVFITPPSDEKRKTQRNAGGGDVWRSIVGPAIDPDNYRQP